MFDDDDLDLFDEVRAEFPKLDDLVDRLVAVWVTGKQGSRQGKTGPYPWIETVTLVLDDGPNGDKATEVVGAAPVTLDKFQYSAQQIVNRLRPRLTAKLASGEPNYRPVIGRINKKASSINAAIMAGGISEPTEDDKATAMKFEKQLRQITAEVKQRREEDEPVF